MTNEVSARDVRVWARQRGLKVGQRGHLPTKIIDAYNHVHTDCPFANPNPWLRPLVSA